MGSNPERRYCACHVGAISIALIGFTVRDSVMKRRLAAADF
jgi:hypothetical protein